jgi:dCMP deaminase
MSDNDKTEVYVRPSWDEYFIQLAELVGTRGTCDRGRTGSVIVKNKRILATGYVGAPVGLPSCDEVGHEIHTVTDEDGTVSKHCIRTSHAEQNAINNAARVGVSIEGGTVYCKMAPCYKCAQSIINSGIVRVVSAVNYHGASRAKEIFKESGVEFVLLNDKIETYKNM